MKLNTEESRQLIGYFLHVSSGKNLSAVLRDGLQQKDLGNYSGYETALPGVYVTRITQIIRDHIFVRQIEDDYLLAVVQVSGPAVIDEDAIDGWLNEAIEQVAKHQCLNLDGLIETIEQDEDMDRIGVDMVPFLLEYFGDQTLDQTSDQRPFLAEFCTSWIAERMVGGDGPDGDWWIEAKQRIVSHFPNLRHREHGVNYSLRVSGSIGFLEPTKIVAVIQIKNSEAYLVWGVIPTEAENLVRSVVGSDDLLDVSRQTSPEWSEELSDKQVKLPRHDFRSPEL